MRAGVLLVVLAAAAYVVAVLALVASDPAGTAAVFGPGSVYSREPSGLSRAYAYLAARRDRVGVLARRIHAGELPDDAVVFQVWNGDAVADALAPSASTDKEDAEDAQDDAGAEADEGERAPAPRGERPTPTPFVSPREAEWVRRGGRLVVATDAGFESLVVAPATRERPRKVFPLWPGVDELRPPRPRVLLGGGIEGTHAVFTAGDDAGASPLVVRLPLGRGEAFLLAVPELLTNAHLAEADHLALLEALAGEGRPVYFDESFHGGGQGAGLFHLLRRWRLVPAALLLVAAAVAAGWRRAGPLGPPEDPHREQRTEAVDLVDSLAGLYARTLRRRDMLALYRRALGETIALATGLHGAALAARLRELAGPPLPDGPGDVDGATFRRRLEELNDAFRRIEDARRPDRRRRVA